MGFDAWFTIGIVLLLVIGLASNHIGADTALLGALTVLMVTGIISPVEATRGFADPAVLMIAALFIVAAGLTETGATEMIAQRVLGRPKTLMGAQLRLMLPVATMSSFMNNTPIVAMYLPIVHSWARKLRISPSRLYMPLSFAAIMGGAITLIGTSSNLVVNQLYLEYYTQHAAVLMDQFGLAEPSRAKQFWWIAVVGAPMLILGVGFIVLASKWLLPERVPPDERGYEGREYTVEVVVEPTSPVVNKSIEQAGLRQLPGLFLTEIQRDGETIPAVAPEEIILADDHLVFVGVVDSVVDLLKIRGLTPASGQARKVQADRQSRRTVEAVVSHTSTLVGQTVRAAQFRTRFNAAIIAVHRGGQRVGGKIGDIILQPGDTLLLSTHAGFIDAYRNSNHFYLISSVVGAREVRHERAWVAIAIMVLLVVMMTIPIPGVSIPPLAAAFFAAALMVFTRCCTGTIARNSIGWQILLIIGASLGIGRALTSTGAAQGIASAILSVADPLGEYGLLAAFALLAMLFCQLITNKGAAVLMFPIAMALAHDSGVSPEPYVVTLMAVTACSFMTPVGFATNLMVYGPGGYRFFDYVRLGGPLSLMVIVLCTVITPFVFPFHP